MSSDPAYDRTYPLPQVFLVDGGGGQPHRGAPPNLIPCWSFPPAQDTARRLGKSRSCMGVSSRLTVLLLLLFALVFAGLGIGTVWTINLQKEMKELKKMVKAVNRSTEETVNMDMINAPQKQIGLYEPWVKGADKEERAAAHVIVRIDKYTQETLRWQSNVGRGFTAGGVAYMKDGALQVNKTGLYHIYSRVELVFSPCSPTTSFIHSVFVRRNGHILPLTLMQTHRQGFCSKPEAKAVETPRTVYQDSYLSSALPLKENDRVFVNVSHPQNLSHGHYANFFGLYKI